MAVASGDGGIGGFAINWPAPPVQRSSAWPRPASCRVAGSRQCPAADALVRQQVEREGVLPGFEVRQMRGPVDHGPHDLLAGRVAQGVNDAAVAVATFASQGQAPAFRRNACPRRPVPRSVGRLADDHLHNLRIAQIAAGLQRIGHVVLEAVLRVDHAGDAPLGEGAVDCAGSP